MNNKGTLRIKVPTSVANDLHKFKEALVRVGALRGCPTCVSGHYCVFETERAFLLDDTLSLRSVTNSPSPSDVIPTVTVTIPSKVNMTLNVLQTTVANVVQRLGCGACTSGFDLAFQEEIGLSMSLTATEAGQII
jgi:hypothetical protein